jgi:hypothetical protein
MIPAVILRIKYASLFAHAMSAAEIDAIAAAAGRSNVRVGVTGVMLAFGGVFMQVLEGPPDVVSDLFVRIERDPRHRDVVILRRELAPTPLFGARSMRLMDLDAGARAQMRPARELIEAVAQGASPELDRLREIDERVWTAGARAVASRRAV